MSEMLEPGQVEECGGGLITYDPLLRKHAVFDASGHLHGYRGSLSRARALASNIPSVSWTPPPAPEPSRSPDAMPLPPAPGVPGGVPRDQQPWRDPPPRVIEAYAESKALTRRYYKR